MPEDVDAVVLGMVSAARRWLGGWPRPDSPW
jgi:hypothetical protein